MSCEWVGDRDNCPAHSSPRFQTQLPLSRAAVALPLCGFTQRDGKSDRGQRCGEPRWRPWWMPALRMHGKRAMCRHPRLPPGDTAPSGRHRQDGGPRRPSPGRCTQGLCRLERGGKRGPVSVPTETPAPHPNMCKLVPRALTPGCRQACDGNLFPSITSSCLQSQFISMVLPSQ